MQELQAQLDSLSPRPPTPPSSSEPKFSDMLDKFGQPAAMQGMIGGSGFMPANLGGFGLQSNFDTSQMRSMASDAAIRNGLDPDLFSAVIETESAFDPMARSKAGAMGLAQLMPDTAAQLGVTDPFNPEQNLEGGAKYLRSLLDQFGDDPKLALAAYNAGPGAVEKYGRTVPPYTETQNYVSKILAKVGG